jgi:hypothetical protein
VLKSLWTTLFGILLLIGALLLILRKGFWGPLILLVLCVLYFGVTIVSEFLKLHGKKVQGRDRHP